MKGLRADNRRDLMINIGGCVVSVAGGLLAVASNKIAVLLLGGAILAFILAANAAKASPLLLLLALPFMRPFLFGERYAVISVALCVTAALLALQDDDLFKKHWIDRPNRSLMFWTGLLWLWQIALITRGESEGDTLRGVVTIPITLLCAVIVMGSPDRRRIVLKGVTFAVVASCISFIITFAMWLVTDFETGELGLIPGGYEKDYFKRISPGQPVFFPFTVTYGLELRIPRFLGWGRESGMAAVVIAWVYLMLPRLKELDRWWIKLVLLLGLLGTQSTAGFGVLLAVWVVSRVLLIRRGDSPLKAYVRVLVGSAGLAAAIYIAIVAPFFGINDKKRLNAESYETRQFATQEGIKAAREHPWGQSDTFVQNDQAAINIIGSITRTGVPGFVISVFVLTMPLVRSKDRIGAAGPVLLVVFTTLTAQPLLQSTGLYLMVGMAASTYQLRRESDEPRESEERPPTTQTGNGRASVAGPQVGVRARQI